MTNSRVKIGVIGDYNPKNNTHLATNASIIHAAAAIGQPAAIAWLPTPQLERNGVATLSAYQGLWCSPGSPYVSMEGALAAIQYAREAQIPFFGT